jgi:hypothetical protein
MLQKNQKRVALIFGCREEPLNLATSTCYRSMCPDGTIIEVVQFDGNPRELTDAEMDEFILKHPISW